MKHLILCIIMCTWNAKHLEHVLCFLFTMFCLHCSSTVLYLPFFTCTTLSIVYLEHKLWFHCSSPEYQRHICMELTYTQKKEKKKHAEDLTLWLKDFMQVFAMNVWSNSEQMYFVLATCFACISLSIVYREAYCYISVLVSVCFRIWM